MGQRFQQKVVLVTGASAGIGRATAEAFAREGARVVLCARRRDELEDVAAQIRRGGREARAVVCDVSVPADVERLVEAAMERWGRIDVVVANAGIGLTGEVKDTSTDNFRRVMDVNVHGVWNTLAATLPILIRQRAGHVVIVSSVLGYRGVPRFAGYCATKAALNALSEGLRTELAPHRIPVTLACPGLTDTEFFKRRLGGGAPEPMREKMHATPPGVVADRIVSAVARRQKRIVVSPGGRFLVWLSRHFPNLTDFGVGRWNAHLVAGEESSRAEPPPPTRSPPHEKSPDGPLDTAGR